MLKIKNSEDKLKAAVADLASHPLAQLFCY
jgi:hypothetical protein